MNFFRFRNFAQLFVVFSGLTIVVITLYSYTYNTIEILVKILNVNTLAYNSLVLNRTMNGEKTKKTKLTYFKYDAYMRFEYSISVSE